ncbi:MAG: excinuclease ABC subunit UvrA [Burkholderiaceae bacterium]
MDLIRIRGARTHNLKNCDLDVPRQRLVVITGISGSGKSSLAFDTLYAEGQRRYVASLSAYARQFLQLMDKPDVDLIEGLSPAIAIEQKAASHNPRSTVGTVTEIHDHLRLLYARAGTPYCPHHPEHALNAQSVSQMVDTVLALPEGRRLLILAPVLEARKGDHRTLLEDLQARGFVRVRVRAEAAGAPARLVVLGSEDPGLSPNHKHTIEVVVDRLRSGADIRQRLAESFETALELGQGRAIVLDHDSGEATPFSNRYACPVCGHALVALEPRLFSFNNPAGACPACDGLGSERVFDPARVVEFPHLSLAAGAIKGWDRRNSFYHQMLSSLSEHYGFDIESPWTDLPEPIRQRILYGSGDEQIAFTHVDGKGRASLRRHPFEGVIPNFERRYRETDSSQVRDTLAEFMSVRPCAVCGGSRLREDARHVRVGLPGRDLDIATVGAMTLSAACDWFAALRLPGARAEVGERIGREIVSRLRFLCDVGLEYLTLARAADSLSGGEAQRIRLASQIGASLSGVMYVLDEPSIGLHQRDNDRLIATLIRLRDLGNSVLVVEHDEDAIRAADHVIDMGPGAGEHGGRVIAQGTPAQIAADADSLTGAYLSGRRSIAVPPTRVAPGAGELVVRGARGNNLADIDVAFPVGLMICVTGVSGSGKSTLVNETLTRAMAHHLMRAQAEPAEHDGIDGLAYFDKIISVDQSPIGRTPRSNPATYTGLFTPIRELFAETPTARERGYGPGRFSFNVRGGRCETCQGDGVIRVEMHFLPDIYVTCDQCGGQRYNRETLEVRYRGRTIADVLEMTVAQAHEFFVAHPVIHRRLQTLLDVGLGYVRLGQSAVTLSGGEAQRVKLSQELSKRDTGRTLYVLDEPTTGLHFHDIAMLLEVLRKLRDGGNTLVVIEHNLDVIKTADWIIDLGPEGGAGGGRVVATGTPEAVAANPDSHTGRYLRRLLGQ